MSSIALVANAAAELARTFRGQLLRPADTGYDDARKVHNGLVDKHPALIARCGAVDDVVEAVALAQKLRLEAAVRGGGHNVAGRATIDGGVLIDLSLMKGIHVDARNRIVRAQGGVTWGELNRETQLHDLAVTGGVVSSTGIAGLTLGGGLGWLMGKYGLALDNLRAAELVTGRRQGHAASPDEEPDLFWAIRGGGGNFGVATCLEYELHPVGPTVTGGPDRAPDCPRPRAAAISSGSTRTSLTDEHTIFASLTHAPDGSGTEVAALVTCHCGAPADAERAMRPLKQFGVTAFGWSRADTLLPAQQHARCQLSERRAQLLEVELPHRAERRCHRHHDRLLRALPDAHGPAAARAHPRCGHPGRRHRHGFSASRAKATTSSCSHSGSTRQTTAACIAWARETYERMQPFFAPGRYVNYLDDDEAGDPVAAAYGPNYRRLQRIKAKYDPKNFFRMNQNIRPLP